MHRDAHKTKAKPQTIDRFGRDAVVLDVACWIPERCLFRVTRSSVFLQGVTFIVSTSTVDGKPTSAEGDTVKRCGIQDSDKLTPLSFPTVYAVYQNICKKQSNTRSWHFFSYSRNSPHFVEYKVSSLPTSQKPARRASSKSYELSPRHPNINVYDTCKYYLHIYV